MNDILHKIEKTGIVPVIKIGNAEQAQPLAKALCEGGIKCAEVTFRTSAAAESIRRMTKAYPDMLIGAGTVLSTEQVDSAVEAGARFIVSPGLNPRVVDYCMEKGITIIPGCSNPSDIEAAIEAGLDVVKFFPAEAAGGLSMIKAMSAPYGNIKFIPTGGIHEKNLVLYLNHPKILACGGSWMVQPEMIECGQFNEIAQLTGAAVSQMLGFELAHIGMHARSGQEANAMADVIHKMFGFEKKMGNQCVFAIHTNSVERAVYYMEQKGFQFCENTAEYDETGKVKSIYLQERIGEFALQFVQRQEK